MSLQFLPVWVRCHVAGLVLIIQKQQSFMSIVYYVLEAQPARGERER